MAGRQPLTPKASERTASAPEEQAGRTRTCVGCSAKVDLRDPSVDVARVVLGPQVGKAHEIAVDPSPGATAGRGAHVHLRAACVRGAAERGLARSFKSALSLDGAPVTASSLAGAMASIEERRVFGMLAASMRAKKAVFGAEAVRSALRSEQAELVVVATDAQAAADLGEVRRAVADGQAVAFGTKATLGEVLSGSPVGVVAILDRQLAAGLRRAAIAASELASFAAGASKPGKAQPRGKGGARAGEEKADVEDESGAEASASAHEQAVE